MKYLTGNQIRNMWLDFFKQKGHHVEKGASLIPYNDPTLLWINSGVAALKKYMDGSEVPPSRRITNVQKSIRTNDMDNVGYTSRHHTFFEMLGCFSIGDYFRKEIIEWAFEILTSKKYFDMPVDKLYFTYNPMDKETHDYWMKQGVKEDHLIPLEGNYWEIGEGPAGPNTEVFFDRGEKYDPNHLGIKLLKDDIENDRYIEIWGIVFSQYNAQIGIPRSEYKELPSKNIDTGAGLERIASVLQESESNFETDLFLPLIKETEKYASVAYSEKTKTPYRVIADHIRAVTFALSDGETFSNEGRGYVLRRLIRRAMRYAKKIGINEAFLYKLVDVVISINKDFYPELLTHEKEIKNNIKTEEEKFLKTLDSGENILRELISNKKSLSGEEAFKLYDTFGFPLDLTKEICHENGVEVDEEGFKLEMEKQKERARNARSDAQSMHKQSKDLLDFKEKSEFTYDDTPIVSKVIGLFKDGQKVDSINDEGEVIFDKTTFYAESGGEVSDVGEIKSKTTLASVLSVNKAPNKQHLHQVKVLKGKISLNDELTLEVDHLKRELTKRNHSATHLLQSAIDKVLLENVKQMGSFVNSEYLRFDFTHNAKINENELSEIEEEVNRLIFMSIDSDIKVLPINEANKLGAKAFFSEKYGDEVRVVKFGDYSIEFCGGCHVNNTKEIGIFAIESEESVASGVRRIQARTSLGAYKLFKDRKRLLNEIKDSLNASSVNEIKDRLNAKIAEEDHLKKEYQKVSDSLASLTAKNLINEFIDAKGYKVLTKYLEGKKVGELNSIGDDLKSKVTDSIIILVGGNDNDLAISIFVTGKALINNNAGALMKEFAKLLGGSGGGRNNIANGKGKDKSKLESSFNDIIKFIK